MDTFEHLVISRLRSSTTPEIEVLANKGKEGWELVSVVSLENGYCKEYYFKRKRVLKTRKDNSIEIERKLLISSEDLESIISTYDFIQEAQNYAMTFQNKNAEFSELKKAYQNGMSNIANKIKKLIGEKSNPDFHGSWMG